MIVAYVIAAGLTFGAAALAFAVAWHHTTRPVDAHRRRQLDAYIARHAVTDRRPRP